VVSSKSNDKEAKEKADKLRDDAMIRRDKRADEGARRN